MGVVSGAVLESGGDVTGVVPWQMLAAGGEGDKMEESAPKAPADAYVLNERGREKVRMLQFIFSVYHHSEIYCVDKHCTFYILFLIANSTYVLLHNRLS